MIRLNSVCARVFFPEFFLKGMQERIDEPKVMRVW